MDQVQVHLLEDQSLRRTKKEKQLFILFLIIIFTLIISAIISVFTALKHQAETQYRPENSIRAIQAVCRVTQYYYPCINSISMSSLHTHHNHKIGASDIFELSVRAALHELHDVVSLPQQLASKFRSPKIKPVLTDCQNWLADSLNQLNKSLIMIMDYYPNKKILANEEMVNDFRVMIGRAAKNVERCVDGLEKENATVEGKIAKKRLKARIYMGKVYVLNSLDILEKKDAIDEVFYRASSVESIFAFFILDRENYVVALTWLSLNSTTNVSIVELKLSKCQTWVNNSLSRLDESLSMLGVDSDVESLTYKEMDNMKAWTMAATTYAFKCYSALQALVDIDAEEKMRVDEVKLGVMKARKYMVNSMDSKASPLLQHDDHLSSIRKRNKTLILIFFSLIILLALIIGAIIVSLVHNHRYLHDSESFNPGPAIRAFCLPSHTEFFCVTSIYSAIITTPNTNPNLVFELSLHKAVEELSAAISMASKDTRFGNCSTSLSHAVSLLNRTLGIMRVNSDIETQTYEQRRDMIAWVAIAIDDLESCQSDLEKVLESTAVGANVYEARSLLRYSKDFLVDCDVVNENFRFDVENEDGNKSSRNRIVEDLIAATLFGSQYFVMVILFCMFLRIYCCK
ncbi:hypothetical protein BUALT_Bualt02G0150000 [Buddleja alternifolia]|uniref:Pectinesterase inhibitor domain-containing protein n=1 Tax=Buddleja alternifolia TaxID=168488 RepID=A0AAV6YB51_9LAMI|nr:hypothetical protein BUALT_Bualt02G0150000 [Buddleja alternifolia]